MTDYTDYLETAWELALEYGEYLPYLLITYVIVTLLPKSLIRMKRFADADYEANRNNYHRCYGPELCCHVLAQEGKVKQKARKPVTRVYPKRQVAPTKSELPPPSPAPVKRSNVTKIARMFETGNTRKVQVNRVAPVTLPEIRMFGASDESRDSTPCASRKTSIASQLSAQLQHIEQTMHLWQELEEEPAKKSSNNNDWEPMAVPVPRRTRGTSATPSTASPLSSSPEPEHSRSPVLLRKPPSLCLQTSMEDIFQVIARSAEEPESDCPDCQCLSPVTSIDDILSERRFSRPLSAYSITDLLNEEQASCVEETTYINDTR
ncbi:uncharacterized protein [Drosophila takahashii]|uniref:uncharacterized protein n=1 Tax=Drosophila takahashii TaxID=29030 RepID=UPI001CF8EF17|nr:uncharacterized protein LOC108067192 [Drosophila takahashii]XP_017011599.2 uncharacterized protein LOC108067192 [Drosophila takahashii]XP_017011601.2 uncharacterized protein LOC108067192 [Drosophila takahashii]